MMKPEYDGGVIESEEDGAIVLEMPWNRLYAVLFALVSIGGMIGFLMQPNMPPVMLPVAGTIAAVVFYAAAAHAMNWTTIRADRSTLDVSVGPLPWLGGGSIDTHRILGFDIEKVVHHDHEHERRHHGPFSFGDGRDKHHRDRFTYTLTASLRGGEDWTVTRGWNSRTPVEYVQWRLREFLGVS